MKIVETVQELQNLIKEAKRNESVVGFVPTMGFLHEGHLSLVDQAQKECDLVVMSIFVNPLQFGPNEDFDRYPRNFERDSRLARNAGVNILFYPNVKEMYPTESAMKVIVHEGVSVLCGKSRPGHFDGVATVVLKLFNIVTPDRAYFGMKDAQQVAVIEKMIRDFNLQVSLIGCPTLREEDGLAKSSRNVNLTDVERKEAVSIYNSLQLAKKLIAQGERKTERIQEEMTTFLETNSSGTIDYIELLTYPELNHLEQLEGKVIIAIAQQYSKARLIDNIVLEIE
ncbi:pantoate--beta-alanine ligase [Alkalihalobacterium chitinilyticum]|uniref:Pantothenate synthetase n=1 Tax=Alkalihalobacterium chitinilyticum TaxID=2980103 RepID=A0ABT5V8V3_9BACI|nr:pantoate--beta-alanine ligase [Alkalihalobacterium chitinilyticum]MDE5411894.1 pantoate--beta-alanine ligase [Alkalihalobacterium chitinilyticum]